ncbi:MAG: hypothetical protein VB934_22050 [Polyangiaceae bacterium]
MSTDPPVSGSRSKYTSGIRPGATGLPSLKQARARRGRARSFPAKFWLWSAVIVGALIVVRWRVAERKLSEDRNALLARQRTIAAELGPRWHGLRGKIEGWTAECAKPKFTKFVATEPIESWDFRTMAGIYLRLDIDSATNVESLRRAAQQSLHDGFTSCLIQAPNDDPLKGKECLSSEDCAVGELCGDLLRCVRHSQPYNLRIAYRTMYILSDPWIAEVHAADGDLSMRVTKSAFDRATRLDIPVALELLNKAKYFMVVVDEPAPVDIDAPNGAKPDADERGVSTQAHDARVCVWRLSDDAPLLAVRLRASGELHGTTPHSEESRKARQRQANSCGLALAVRDAIAGR